MTDARHRRNIGNWPLLMNEALVSHFQGRCNVYHPRTVMILAKGFAPVLNRDRLCQFRALPSPPPMMASASDTDPRTQSTAMPLPESVQALRTSVKALSASVEILLDRKTTMSDSKESIKQIVDSGDRIVTAVVASCQQLQSGHVPIIANSLITVTQEMVDEWTRFMGDRAIKTSLKRFLLMLSTNSYLASFRDAIIVIEEMFKIENRIAQAIVDPEGCFNLRFAKPGSAVSLSAFNLLCSRMQDLPQLSKGLAAYEGLKVVVQGMANMTDGAPWPWKAIPQTLIQFTAMVERSLDKPKKIQYLSDKIGWRIALLLNISEKHGRSDDQLERCVETFLCDAQRIIIRLRIIEKVHPAKAFPLTEYISKIIDDEASKMQEAHKQLESQFLVKTTFTVSSIADGVASVEKTLIEIRDGVRTLLEGRSVEAAHHVHVLARLPGCPEVLNGRTSDLIKYVRLLCGAVPARIVIIGPGGIGKTSLAKALLYREEVVAVFGDHRFFISVEAGSATSDGSACRVYSFLMSLPRVLLVIDNLETLWFSKDDSAQAGTAQLFRRLKDITSLTLIVTCRSGTTPDGIIWSNESSAELRPISLDAAYDTFVKLSRPPETTAEEVSLKDLLQAVDCMPLAVTLLARLAKLPGKCPSSLLKQWHSEHTKMMAKTSDRGREFNVEVSIQVSLDLLAFTGADEEAEQLLFVCALLPDGLRPEVFEQISDSFKNITEAKDLLLTFALVSLGRDGELIMLSPVRHFVLSQFPATSTDQSTSSHLVALRKIYFRIAATAPQDHSEDFTSRVSAFAPEYGNLSSYLLHLIDREEPSKELFDAVIAASEYSYLTYPSAALLDALRPRLDAHSRWLARCLGQIGRIRLKRCEYALCMESLIQARVLYEEHGDVDAQILCACLLAQSLDYCGRSEDAEQELDLGRIYFAREEYEAATYHYVTAKDECLRTGQRLYAAQCSQQLAVIAIRQGRLPAAELDIQLALSEFEALGDLVGLGQCFADLGEIKYLQSDLESAATLFARAEVTLASGRKKDALDKFDAARILWESIDTKACQD
ncbi:hypothetical protein BKA62DRAFT_832154 [Auriculariales sp. MPI-PUGE-AT-0066]|nr:hypothetical protein BKA62DRAFT_832154 [Auriculariales sp. MPI-PUGE-AT-0066]